jgi:outer membrane biosynthesis protein TonB
MYARFLPILLLLAASCLSAQEPGKPPAVPQTLEQADTQILRAETLRKDADALYASEQAACYNKILVNACLSDAKQRHTATMIEARELELPAREFKREANRRDVETEKARREAERPAQEAERQKQAEQYRAEETEKASARAQKEREKEEKAVENRKKLAEEQAARQAKAEQRARRNAEKMAKKEKERAKAEAKASKEQQPDR